MNSVSVACQFHKGGYIFDGEGFRLFKRHPAGQKPKKPNCLIRVRTRRGRRDFSEGHTDMRMQAQNICLLKFSHPV
jgi:hypothetical protein